ncbi:Asp-tRNA(Asn)/Glu-tRNA(Gln) amidotransferase subunit GatA [Eisenibacter elegans]|uniref:Asp-tRNA(Asn)/Glu-tRNA(Gln) amidotransferase subunit GatA n=1 Tax=Eisenibacter elegans TaxID=997 RepID=UPI000424FB23|nr:Asp-tRNA(Asn)/Glu-tRNA(Gln) amidotransferase subunit GatA [Eisenibacter elegans]
MTCLEKVNQYLARIEEKKDLNIFLSVFTDEARQQAALVDQKIAAGTAGALAGMVVGIKDVLCYQDHPLQCASKILDGFHSQFTATAVERLIAADAVIIGRQNCDEFAMGSSNENSAFGPTLNPHDPSRVPGGSSGASAAAIAASLCDVSLGTDTGGSVRQPAAFCGVVGLKPTYGRISRYGLAAYASSFDCIGIFASDSATVAKVLEVIAGADAYDSTASRREVPAYSQRLQAPAKARVAYIRETLDSPGLQPEIKAAMEQKLDQLRQQGHEVSEVTLPLLDYILPTYYILTTAEASSNLSRYDGVRYGYRSPNAQSLEEMYKLTRAEGFGKEVQRRIMLGAFVLSANYYDAYYTKAQRVRRLIKEATDAIFAQHDFIVLPTTPTTAFALGAHNEDPIQMYLADLYTVQANVVGIPAISIPVGTDQDQLPIGLQIMAQSFQEEQLLAFATYLENLS